MSAEPSPVCTTILNDFNRTVQNEQCDCPNCGKFRLTDQAATIVERSSQTSPDLAAVVSHAIWKMQRVNEWPLVRSDTIERLASTGTLPNPAEQAENLVLCIGRECRYPGRQMDIDRGHLRARIGALNTEGVAFILDSLRENGLLLGGLTKIGRQETLSLSGWERFHQLLRHSSKGAGAFMAMDFNQPDIARMFQECFKPAALRAGFNLFRLDDEPKAGLIDERLRVEIRRCLFLVADLTHRNPGAYWEAGFAEGLGKPVIYTCRKDVFDDEKTHFDTNHLHTVVWTESDGEKASQELTATIRNTLPDEATMSDD
jgi:hypothetical protein